MKIGQIVLSIMLGFLNFILPTEALADPSTQVGRLSYSKGDVSFLPAGETSWVKGTLNRPLITGDQLWADSNARVEVQLSGSDLRLGNQTNLKILQLDPKIAQFQMTQGTVALTINRMNSQQVYEIDTPNLAYSISEPGYYRLDISPQNNATTVTVRKGQGTAYGQSISYPVHSGQSCSANGTNLDGYQCETLPAVDAFDQWNTQRNHPSTVTSSIRHVSPETIGYEDLESNGHWNENTPYGSVWIPDRVDPNWAPYRYGHWVWLGQWGWTWVDDQPWGFAPFHYGRWAYLQNQWCWVPGPVNEQPIYAPALIVFVGGNNFQLALSSGAPGVAWFPLAPGEIYIPAYQVSRTYFAAINMSNTRVNAAYVTNIYDHRHTDILYRNAHVANAVTAVPTRAFVQSESVNRAFVHLPTTLLNRAPLTQFNTIVPKPISVLGGAGSAHAIPTRAIISRPTISRTTPPPAPLPFSQEQRMLTTNGGRPLTSAQVEGLRPAHPLNPNVRPVTPQQPMNMHQSQIMHHQPSMTPQSPVARPPTPSPHSPLVQPTPNAHQPRIMHQPQTMHQPHMIQPAPRVQQPRSPQQPHTTTRPPQVIHHPEDIIEPKTAPGFQHDQRPTNMERSLHAIPEEHREMRPQDHRNIERQTR
ncbi:MAG: hypothetical protein NTW94_05260 [Legionellales bacterium]|nr:hypothetical protein [Legionellales bacterium]